LVIKAITAYQSNRIVELSFQKGDFFHVVGERDDHEGSWFEASNPATGARGIVPKDCFELFGRKQNELPSTTPTATAFPPRSSAPGYQSSANNPPGSPLLVRTPLSAEPFRQSHPNSKTQPLYGIVRLLPLSLSEEILSI
jgi:bud emergence protein 1